ncbi:hypothetical protein BH10BAC1_BH10BAC1_11730 [soil metagenome]
MKLTITLFLTLTLASVELVAQKDSLSKYSKYETLDEMTPQMILIEGADINIKDKNELPVTAKIYSFSIAMYEETNKQYRAYLDFLLQCKQNREYLKALPDTALWLNENFPKDDRAYLVQNYFRNEQFDDYPVVGLSPKQIEVYSKWKTDRMAELTLIREGILDYATYDSTFVETGFTLDNYLDGIRTKQYIDFIPSLDPNGGERLIRSEDGIYPFPFRLPTLYEWELAALAIGDENYTYRIGPKSLKQKKFDPKNKFGFLFVNKKEINFTEFQKKLLLKGIAPVYCGTPNNYAVYHLNDNVSEITKIDSSTYLSIGNSWKDTSATYDAKYSPSIGSTTKYLIRKDFKIQTIDAEQTSVSGFRLVVTIISRGDYYYGKKKKIKRKKGNKLQ